MQIEFLKPKFPKFYSIKGHFANMYKRHCFTNNGPLVQQLEKRMSGLFEYDGEVVSCSNGTVALQMAYKILGCRKALVPSFTFPATVQALFWCGIDYEFVDIDPKTWTMNIQHLEEMIHKTGADLIIPVHSFGNPCDVQSIAQLAAINNCKVVYDAAPAISSFVEIEGKAVHVSNFGDISCFSLHATKALAAGEGGAMFVKERELGEDLRALCNFGFDDQRIPRDPYGTNAKMSEIHAAFGLSSLEQLAFNQKDRMNLVSHYKYRLKDFGEHQEVVSGNVSTYQVFPWCLPDHLAHFRDDIIQEMGNRGIQLRKYYNPCLHMIPVFVRNLDLPITEDVSSRILTLPLHLWMNLHEVDVVVDNLFDVIKKLGGIL